MKTIILFSSLILAALAAPSSHGGDTRIIGAEDAYLGEFPFYTSIHKTFTSIYSREMLCSGVVISERHVLTTASCLQGHSVTRNNPPYPEYVVIAGNYKFNHVEHGQEQLRYVKTLIPHKDFDAHTLQNDIGIVLLQDPFIFVNIYVKPIDLPVEMDPKVNDYATFIGFGDVTQSGIETITLQKANVRVIPNDLCSQIFQESFEVTDSMMCAGKPMHDAVPHGQKDHADPLICSYQSDEPVNQPPEPFVCGVLNAFGSHPYLYTSTRVYTDVSHHLDWIQDTMKNTTNLS